MKKRQLKKLAKRAVEQCKQTEFIAPIRPIKLQKALGVYLYKHRNDSLKPKIIREFWQWFYRNEIKGGF